jgi:hypothetical protein
MHYFGFSSPAYTDKNAGTVSPATNIFQGDMLAGTLNFTGYTGNQTVTITVVKMTVIRIDENKQTVETVKESPAYVYTIQRKEGGGSNGDGGNSGGNSGGGTGADASAVTSDPANETVTKQHHFDDVDETHYSWALEAVDALAEQNVINGIADRIYAPAANIKRGDFMLMLVRAYGINDAFTDNFPDVPQSSYYYNAIGSAKVQGIAQGYPDGKFHPTDAISRQDMMVLIDRTLQQIGKPLPRGSESDISIFSDRDKISSYARDSVAALVKSGIIQGSGTDVNPSAYTTRAEMAVALYRLLNVAKS